MEKNQETLKEIEKKRKELGLSQVELAKRIGFSRGYYNMLIHGKKPVSDKLADQLQNVLQEYRKEKESGYRNTGARRTKASESKPDFCSGQRYQKCKTTTRNGNKRKEIRDRGTTFKG